jgi:hypothetical protein
MQKAAFVFITSLVFLVSIDRRAQAGWFGPSNYDECVLQKMKGQAAYMYPNASAACREEFPAPAPIKDDTPQTIQFDGQLIKYREWKMNDNGDFAVEIIDKPRGYSVSTIRGVFVNRAPCNINETEISTAPTFWGKKVEGSDLFRFSISGSQFNCMYLAYFGTIQN